MVQLISIFYILLKQKQIKIKVLPNYEKYNMGNNLPFITIFQMIEI